MARPLRSFIRRIIDQLELGRGVSLDKVWDNMAKLIVAPPLVRLEEVGGEFYIDPRSHIFVRIVAFGYYEPKISNLLKEHLRRDKDAIDVGANVGLMTTLMSKGCSAGRILSCEPTPHAHALLEKNIQHNKLKNVIVFNGAVSDKVGNIEISFIEGMEEYSSIESIGHTLVSKHKTRSAMVQTSTIDELVSEHNLDPCLIKVDVEGAEALVLRGAIETIKKFKPTIVSEICDSLLKEKGSSAKEYIESIQSFGYRVLDAETQKLWNQNKSSNEIIAIAE